MTEPVCHLTNMLDFTSQTRAVMWALGQGQTKKKNTQYTLCSHAEEGGFKTHEQEGLPAEPKSDIIADYGQRCGYCIGQGIL